MKAQTLNILLLLLSVTVQAQDLFICRVKGTVMASGKELKVGDKLKESDSKGLDFNSREDFLIVVSPVKGRCILSAKNAPPSESHLWILIKDNLLPCKKQNTLYTRSTNDPDDPRDYLADGRLAVTDSVKIPLSDVYTRNFKESYFYILYDYQSKVIRKDFHFSPEKPYLLIDQNLFEDNGKRIASREAKNMFLSYHDGEWNNDQKMMDVQILLMTDPDIQKELRIAYEQLQVLYNQDKEGLYEDLTVHIRDYYGQIKKMAARKYIDQLK